MKSTRSRDIVTAILLAGILVHMFLSDPRTTGCLKEIKEGIYDYATSNQENAAASTRDNYTYLPASSEDFVYQNMEGFGFDSAKNPPTCPAIKSPEVKPSIDQYRKELEHYYELIQDFKPIDDLRLHLDRNFSICERLDLVPGGLTNIFQSQQLSWTPSGFVEPLLPPFRHLDFCDVPHRPGAPGTKNALLNMKYLVHDFGYMCRALKRHSRIVLVDMGASLEFMEQVGSYAPAIYLTSVYQKMGFKFDHIYAFERNPAQSATVFKLVPESLQSAYHWINIGVSSEVGSKDNPLTMLLREYDEDDLIVVKLDIDTSFIEVPLAYQILNDDRFSKLIDHFYFEHHVHMKELAPWWGYSMNGTVEESLKLFSGMRRKGIPAHYWP